MASMLPRRLVSQQIFSKLLKVIAPSITSPTLPFRTIKISARINEDQLVKNVMDMLDFADAEFTMLDHERKKNKELFPALPSTEEKLRLCSNKDEVLSLLLESFNENTFNFTDVMPYWKFLILHNDSMVLDEKEPKYQKSEVKKQNLKTIMPTSLLSNVIFQRLLFETFSNTQHILTKDLTKLFLYIVSLRVPTNSFVFSHVLELMKTRINEFFVEDVAICLLAIQKLSSVPKKIEVFEKGLLMHIENQLNSSSIFRASLKQTPSCDYLLLLLNSKCFTDNANPETKNALITACNQVFASDIRKTMNKCRSTLVMEVVVNHPEMSSSVIAKYAEAFLKKNHL